MAKPSRIQLSYQRKSKRMIKVKQERRLAIRKGAKPSTIKPTHFEAICDKFINLLLRRKQFSNGCEHFLIGASNLHSFILGHHSMKVAHNIFFTPAANKITGQAGEESFKRTHSNIFLNHPFGIHKSIPMLCSTTDFITKDLEGNTIIEIKTFDNYERAKSFLNKPDDRAVLQILTQMEIFQTNNGKLVIYYLDRISKTVLLIGGIRIEKTTLLFTTELRTLMVLRYVAFLKEYFEELELYPCDDYFSKLLVRLARNFSQSLPNPKKTSQPPFIKSFKRKLKSSCQYLDKLSTYVEPQSVESFRLYDGMFQDHKFINRSKLKLVIHFNEEYRRDFLTRILSKIDKETRDRIERLQNNLLVISKPKDFIIDKQIRRVEQKYDKPHYLQNDVESAKIKKLRSVIKHQNRRIEELKSEVELSRTATAQEVSIKKPDSMHPKAQSVKQFTRSRLFLKISKKLLFKNSSLSNTTRATTTNAKIR